MKYGHIDMFSSEMKCVPSVSEAMCCFEKKMVRGGGSTDKLRGRPDLRK